MKYVSLLLLFALSQIALASSNQDHTCQGGHNCNTYETGGGGSHNEQDQTQTAVANASAVSVSSASVSSENTNFNLNDNTAYGGNASATGGAGGNAEQAQSQSSTNNNANSSNNSSSQSTSVNFEAAKTYRYSNNVSAIAPNIYSSSACTAGGLTGAASALGVGVSLGGAKQDIQCQVRENARILAGLDVALAIEYLCKNTKVDVGATLGAACQYNPPVVEVVLPPVPDAVPPIIVTDTVHGK